MAAITAEGEGNRFIAIAVETSEPVPFDRPGHDCQKVGFAGVPMRGLVEVVESPQIDGVHARSAPTASCRPWSTESPHRRALQLRRQLRHFLVIVTANPLVLPDKPVAAGRTRGARATC